MRLVHQPQVKSTLGSRRALLKSSKPCCARSLHSRNHQQVVTTAAALTPGRLYQLLPSFSSITTTSVDENGTTTSSPAAKPSTPAPQIDTSSTSPILSCAGGGIFFFWELGAIKYLQEKYNLNDVQFVGASAGALVAVLMACGVQPDRAVQSAYDLSIANNIWSRPGGLAGIWGSIIRQWLDELLPDNAAELCNGRVKLIATEVPSLGLRYLDDFTTKQQVINACMASVHIPFFLDGNATCTIDGGAQYIDGSLWDFLSGDNSALIKCNGAACIIDYFFDDQLQYNRLDFIKLAQFDEVTKLMDSGYAWAQRMDAQGGFDSTLGSVRKWALRRWVEYPMIRLTRALA